jgi:DNA polymerase (family 10)
VINPDAHEVDGLAHLRAGVSAARKGWLSPTYVMNCLTLSEMEGFLSLKQPLRSD